MTARGRRGDRVPREVRVLLAGCSFYYAYERGTRGFIRTDRNVVPIEEFAKYYTHRKYARSIKFTGDGQRNTDLESRAGFTIVPTLRLTRHDQSLVRHDVVSNIFEAESGSFVSTV